MAEAGRAMVLTARAAMTMLRLIGFLRFDLLAIC